MLQLQDADPRRRPGTIFNTARNIHQVQCPVLRTHRPLPELDGDRFFEPAVVLDYTPQIGGGYANSHGLYDVTLTNSSKSGDNVREGHAAVCQKLGGCGSKAIGIQIGGVNSGAQSGEIANVRVMGFGTGIQFKNNGSAISWGMIFRNDSFAYNNVGISVPTVENLSFFGGRIAVNGTGISLTGGAEVYAIGLSIDSNSVSGVTGASNSSFTCTNCHFENETGGAPITTHYYDGTQAATFVLIGGQALDDTPSSASSTDYWFSQSGASLYITGLQVYSAGRRAAKVVRANSPAVGSGFDHCRQSEGPQYRAGG